MTLPVEPDETTTWPSQMLTGTSPGSLAVWNLMLFTAGIDTINVTWSRS